MTTEKNSNRKVKMGEYFAQEIAGYHQKDLDLRDSSEKNWLFLCMKLHINGNQRKWNVQ